MKSRLIKQALLSLLLVIPVRVALDLYPDEGFWHLRELLDFPGGVAQGFIAAILYYGFSNDPSDYPAGVDNIINFVWLYCLVFLIVALIWRVFNSTRSN
jgi:hypothetical protein